MPWPSQGVQLGSVAAVKVGAVRQELWVVEELLLIVELLLDAEEEDEEVMVENVDESLDDELAEDVIDDSEELEVIVALSDAELELDSAEDELVMLALELMSRTTEAKSEELAEDVIEDSTELDVIVALSDAEVDSTEEELVIEELLLNSAENVSELDTSDRVELEISAEERLVNEGSTEEEAETDSELVDASEVEEDVISTLLLLLLLRTRSKSMELEISAADMKSAKPNVSWRIDSSRSSIVISCTTRNRYANFLETFFSTIARNLLTTIWRQRGIFHKGSLWLTNTTRRRPVGNRKVNHIPDDVADEDEASDTEDNVALGPADRDSEDEDEDETSENEDDVAVGPTGRDPEDKDKISEDEDVKLDSTGRLRELIISLPVNDGPDGLLSTSRAMLELIDCDPVLELTIPLLVSDGPTGMLMDPLGMLLLIDALESE